MQVVRFYEYGGPEVLKEARETIGKIVLLTHQT